MPPDTKDLPNAVTIEYGENPLNPKPAFYRIMYIKNENIKIYNRPDLKRVSRNFKHRTFSKFITSSAEQIVRHCFKRAIEKARSFKRNPNSIKRFFVVHLRGTDRPCAFKRLKPKNVLSQLEAFGLKRATDVVYVMTDLKSQNDVIREIKNYFKDYYMFLASEIDLYDDPVFARTAAFLIYATEIQLQELADGIVDTYRGHKMKNYEKVVGYLSPWQCSVETWIEYLRRKILYQ